MILMWCSYMTNNGVRSYLTFFGGSSLAFGGSILGFDGSILVVS